MPNSARRAGAAAPLGAERPCAASDRWGSSSPRSRSSTPRSARVREGAALDASLLADREDDRGLSAASLWFLEVGSSIFRTLPQRVKSSFWGSTGFKSLGVADCHRANPAARTKILKSFAARQ